MMVRSVVFLACAAALVACAAAQGCPASTCSAGFNAAGGWKDCCYHDYKANARCQWAGTPVSWSNTRTCSGGDGKQYLVLVQGNFQGPPSPSAECRCSNALPPAPAKPGVSSVQMCATLTAKADVDIKGSDIPCDGQSICMVCGDLKAVQDRCRTTRTCVAFTFEPATQCGYLKSSGNSMTGRTGWITYAR